MLLLAFVVTQAFAVPRVSVLRSEPVRLMKVQQDHDGQPRHLMTAAADQGKLNLCNTCIVFAHDFIQDLLNIVLSEFSVF